MSTFDFHAVPPPEPCPCPRCQSHAGFDSLCDVGQLRYVEFLEALAKANGQPGSIFFTVRKFRALEAGEPRGKWVAGG